MSSSRRDHVGIAEQYARDIVAGKIPAGRYARLACQRQLDDLSRWAPKRKQKAAPFQFDVARASRVCQFAELLPHVKGELAGQLLVLQPWQAFIYATVFGWVDQHGMRRFRRSYKEIPRGNGKSAMTAPAALYMMAADREGGAECYAFATTAEQARIVFDAGRNMTRHPRANGLRSSLGVEAQQHSVHQLNSGSFFRPMSAEGSTLDGLNTHFGAIDELHAHKTRDVYDVVETSIGKRRQPLLWVITTAGSNRSGICYEVRGFVIKVLERPSLDETQFGIIYGIDKDDDWTTEAALIKANPNWGISVMPDTVLKLQAKAMTMASAANNFKTKHLNEWVNADVAWMNMHAWEACADRSLKLSDFKGHPVIIGLDLASRKDIAAQVYIFERVIDGVRHYYLFGQYYLPRETVEAGENSQYSGWEQVGRLTVTEGDTINFDEIEQSVIDDCRTFEVAEVPYDPFQATQLSTRLIEQNVPMIEMRPTVLNFSEPMKELEALVLQGRLHHDGCPVMEWMMSNVVAHVDAKDNIYPRKERAENKIDGPVAAIMALGRWMMRAAEGAPTVELL